MIDLKKFLFSLFLFLLGPSSQAYARVSLPSIFGNHMVLQQQAEVALWGWANPMEEIIVRSSWDNAEILVKGDNYARWKVILKTPVAGGPYEISVQGNNQLVIRDILIGEVWLGSGQSNMEWAASYGIDRAEDEIAAAAHPQIRLFQVYKRAANGPQEDLQGQWEVCSPESMANFSATAYFFARELQTHLDIPIGVINSSWGGTPAEAWIDPAVIAGDPLLAEASKKIGEMPWCPEVPGSTYNSMIYPLIPFKIAGVIWYQGETNTANATAYRAMFTALINSWRKAWGVAFPFYYVQIAPYKYEVPEEGVLVREAQLQTLELPGTGMVVVSDIGNIGDIHPRNKQDVGKRLASWALANTYGQEGISFSGPLFREAKPEGNKVRIFFSHTGEGLVAKGGELTHFEISGDDGQYVPARAIIDGKTVLVSSKKIRQPKGVRFAWSNTAEPNLFNTGGLPASSFRTKE